MRIKRPLRRRGLSAIFTLRWGVVREGGSIDPLHMCEAMALTLISCAGGRLDIGADDMKSVSSVAQWTSRAVEEVVHMRRSETMFAHQVPARQFLSADKQERLVKAANFILEFAQ